MAAAAAAAAGTTMVSVAGAAQRERQRRWRPQQWSHLLREWRRQQPRQPTVRGEETYRPFDQRVFLPVAGVLAKVHEELAQCRRGARGEWGTSGFEADAVHVIGVGHGRR